VLAVAGLAALPATGAAVPAAGLNTAGEAMYGVDRRPATGALYGLGVVDTGPTSVRTTLSATLTDAAGNPTKKSTRITVRR
jgi:hypothetical protein